MSCRAADHKSRIIPRMTRGQKLFSVVIAALCLAIIPIHISQVPIGPLQS